MNTKLVSVLLLGFAWGCGAPNGDGPSTTEQVDPVSPALVALGDAGATAQPDSGYVPTLGFDLVSDAAPLYAEPCTPADAGPWYCGDLATLCGECGARMINVSNYGSPDASTACLSWDNGSRLSCTGFEDAGDGFRAVADECGGQFLCIWCIVPPRPPACP